jgi:hypothetical protein
LEGLTLFLLTPLVIGVIDIALALLTDQIATALHDAPCLLENCVLPAVFGEGNICDLGALIEIKGNLTQMEL